jgi:molybdopterin-binding protein
MILPIRFIPKESYMKLSARNQLKGKIVAVTKGQTTAHVRIDIGGGVIVTSSITNEAVDDLALKVGDERLYRQGHSPTRAVVGSMSR